MSTKPILSGGYEGEVNFGGNAPQRKAAMKSTWQKWKPWHLALIGVLALSNAAYLQPSPWAKACSFTVVVIVLCRMATEWNWPNKE